jgi:hypothetical protein
MRQEDILKLQNFVNSSKSQGAPDDFLAALLTRRGWPAADVYAALGKYWEAATGLAIPERAGAGGSARDAFLYLLSFCTLATWTTAVGSLLFEFINHWLPDAVSRNKAWDLRASITWQMACLAVAFPIYVLVMRTILREATVHPESLESSVRKWLTYLALLGTAGAMIGDLICFLNYFLDGELTMRFVLKSATVMAIAGAVFSYYLASLRWNRSANVDEARSRSAVFAAVAAAVAIATFSVGLLLAGTPSKQRQLEADRKRVDDLRNLGAAINLRIQQNPNATLPATLAELRSARITDPETNAPYSYLAKGGTSYELCADFSAASDEERSRYGNPSTFWAHGTGRSCFALDASKSVP